MRGIFTILIVLNVLVLLGREPDPGIDKEKSLTSISAPIIKSILSFNPNTKEFNNELNIDNPLLTYFSTVQQKIYRRERFYIKSRFSGRTEPLLKATNMKLSYKYVVFSFPVNQTNLNKHTFLLNSSPFVSVLLNRKSIYSPSYAFHSTINSDQPDSLHDLGVSIGAGIRVPISSKFQLDVGVRDELGLLNLDGFISGKNSFSSNNSIGVILGLKYKI